MQAAVRTRTAARSRPRRWRRVGPWWMWVPVAVAVGVSLAAWLSSAPPRAATRTGSGPAVAVTAVPATTPSPSPWTSVDGVGRGSRLGAWRLRDRMLVLAQLGDQGLASVKRPGRPELLVFRGGLSVPADLRRAGWDHVGDPGGWRGYLVDAYQAPPAAHAKLFVVTDPKGATHRYLHRLTAGEEPNNSFAAMSPDGRWLVSGEWGRMGRLLEFSLPLEKVGGVNGPSPLPLAATVSLNHPVRNVQGCAFVSSVQLLCASDDPGTDLWPTPYQLLRVDLPRPLDGQPVTATVTSLGELPLTSRCTGAYEVEGIDYQAGPGTLRVEVRPPGRCGLSIAVYEYRVSTTASP